MVAALHWLHSLCLHRVPRPASPRPQEVYERKRAEQYHREQSKWDRQEGALQRDEQRMAALRTNGQGARRNQSSAAFNILTLDYDKSPKGAALAAHDEASKARSQMRAVNIYTRNHSVSHDIINHRPLNSISTSSYQTVAPWDK